MAIFILLSQNIIKGRCQMIKQLNKVYDGQVIEDRGVCAFCDYPQDNDCIICNGGVFDFVKP